MDKSWLVRLFALVGATAGLAAPTLTSTYRPGAAALIAKTSMGASHMTVSCEDRGPQMLCKVSEISIYPLRGDARKAACGVYVLQNKEVMFSRDMNAKDLWRAVEANPLSVTATALKVAGQTIVNIETLEYSPEKPELAVRTTYGMDPVLLECATFDGSIF